MEHAFSPDIHAKILIVDDDPMMRLLMRESLENETYAIEEVDNGLAALEHIRKNPPDMVLLDVKMPGLSGFDVCAQIREKYDTNSISIVVVTGL
ncbi:MAG TPA: response regulator, partial [Thiotrichales bacterium]|nr:response regulator [Thiotrichales bacterium]